MDAEAMPASEEQALEAMRERRLRRALELYERVRSDLELKDPRRRGELERAMLRNATFYRGDCAFDLGDYESAIKYYDTAAQRYGDEPGSLVAMVQIVNAYAALGKWREAETAHERARTRLEQLPEESWERSDVPMGRRHWERWLESSVMLEERRASAGG
jgi:tetratricopeptide (TPR) repeat protein